MLSSMITRMSDTDVELDVIRQRVTAILNHLAGNNPEVATAAPKESVPLGVANQLDYFISVQRHKIIEIGERLTILDEIVGLVPPNGKIALSPDHTPLSFKRDY